MSELLTIVRLMISQKKDVILSVVFGYIAGIAAVGLFAANGYLISRAALEPPLYVLITMVAVVKIGSFIRAISRYAERYYSHRATFTMLSELRVYFYEKVEQHAPSLFHKYRSGDLLARIVGDVESLQHLFLRVFYPPIIMITVFVSTILFVSFYSMKIVVLLVVGLALTGLIIPAWFAKKQKKVSNRLREERASLSTEVTEWFYGFRELKIHQKLEDKEQQLVNASNQYIFEQQREGTQGNVNQATNVAIALVISWAVLAMGAFLVAHGNLDGVFLAMLVMVSLTVFEHSTPMAVFPIHYEDSERAAKRLNAVIESEDEEQEQVQTKEITSGPPTVKLNEVSFSFPNDDRNILSDVNVVLPAGSKTAIVGPSGSGKSTLLQLLLKLYPATAGEISLSGVPVTHIDQENLWQKTNVVLQENHFFFGTIKDNLLLQTDNWSDDELQQVLDAVQLKGFSLKDTVLEKGQNLSGGEKQRLAMARALVKNASFWILDEPTSSLDSWTEQQIYELLYRQAKNDTVVLVSHRLAGLERMDQIIVMDQGKIVESGTFNDLIKMKGYFYKLKQVEKSILLS
ncbi:thiol reductant ABC exporter subunit CydC [Halalkalibacter alkalisediminis]|uniref:Thiol reductant ABC exporter subunit CydC n=1 Tax=Halalkalibacter alkalisediminis TaxID=935616 RepID=A0ABV6NDV6_9BACI|nr:thiol reductant ABC exporter subunit CydC [Halalkalibacter alkalisediminis]